MTVTGPWINKFYEEVHFYMDNGESLWYFDCFVELRETYFAVWHGKSLTAMINVNHVISIEFYKESEADGQA